MILIVALITSFYVTKPGFNDILSYISSFASIAISCIAIYISIKEVTKADTMKNEIHVLVGELNEKVRQIDNKLNRIDMVNVNKEIDNTKLNELADLLKKQQRKIEEK